MTWELCLAGVQTLEQYLTDQIGLTYHLGFLYRLDWFRFFHCFGFSDLLTGAVTGCLDFSNMLTGLWTSCLGFCSRLTGCGISTGTTCPENSNALTCLAEVIVVVLDISTDAVVALVS